MRGLNLLRPGRARAFNPDSVTSPSLEIRELASAGMAATTRSRRRLAVPPRCVCRKRLLRQGLLYQYLLRPRCLFTIIVACAEKAIRAHTTLFAAQDEHKHFIIYNPQPSHNQQPTNRQKQPPKTHSNRKRQAVYMPPSASQSISLKLRSPTSTIHMATLQGTVDPGPAFQLR